jgi:hypothetical protein
MGSVASNPLSCGAPPRRHPRLLPDGTREAMFEAVRTARDRMIVTWLADSGMRNQLVRDRDDLRRKLNGARANISRLAERRVTELFPDGPGKTMPS